MAVAALALALALPGTALADPGDLDPAFGGDGKVVTDVANVEDSQDVALQLDGKIVTIGSGFDFDGPNDFVLVRYNTDGSLDTGFGGGDGIVFADLDGGSNDEGQAVAVQPDGKIVAVGRSDTVDGTRARLAVARFDSEGNPDGSFGDGGKVITDFGTGTSGYARAVALQSDGRIVAAGLADGDFLVARYTANGSPDTGFGNGGTARTAFAEGGASVHDVALQSDGRIVAAGQVGYTSPDFVSDFALARYNSDGSPDTGFGGDGTVTTAFDGEDAARGVAVQSDGRIVAAGYAAYDFALARYNSDGSPDISFGGDGTVTTDSGQFERAYDMALQPDGRIVAIGGIQQDFALARYNTDGSLDAGFGAGGRVTTDFETFYDEAHAVAVQPDGKIVVSGNGSDNHAVARYEVSSTPPPAVVDLAVTKTGPATVSIGDQASYTVTVHNTSATAATGVTLADTLTGAGGTLLSATPSQGTCATTATSANCTLGTLLPDASATVTVVAEPRATGTLSDTATVSAAESDPVPANNTATATTTVNNARGCTIVGTSGADTLNGGFNNDVICGLGGNDTIRPGFGNDTAHGGTGNDNIDGSYGNDTLNGGPGSDVLTGSYGNDTLNSVDSVSANDTANGGPGIDTCTTDPGDTRISCP
ncbi:calcium-binding protein [Streptomyces sp. NPDC059909]|uniref:calcium-binding protein n=1 Tax=Streptomyces sp. NPDC059909 TaxID=3346998 RepID=UPI003653F70B